ncbi:hypothetical protein SAMN05428997_1033 [Bosea sp. CRIB-10]|uniref:hypothetical protein n=1 Tax=Bosea sp. CRIB-10 TaxID=378404 RepID=UPI0008E1CD51|nr:hypothetical protein [Bosea sp. CRIB-10]SFB92306.1 hypothetical protein SAMN05428997_1033 [Bosea sp. CRIB-10]
MPSRFDQLYRWGKRDIVNDDALNLRFRDLDNRITPIEALKISYEAALLTLQDRVLERSEAVIEGLRDRLIEITELAWLVGSSSTGLTLVEEAEQALIIAPDRRALFTPGPFAIVATGSDPDAYAVVQHLDFDRATGQWNFRTKVVSAALTGAHADWSIGALAGSTLAQMALLEEGQAARTETLAARDEAVPAATVATEAAGVAVGAAGTATGAAGIASTKAGEASDAATAAAISAASVDGPAIAASLAALAAADTALDTRLDAVEPVVSALQANALVDEEAIALAIAYGG